MGTKPRTAHEVEKGPRLKILSVVALFTIDIISIKIYNNNNEEVLTMIALAEYADRHSKSHIAARKMAARGGFQTAVKIARNWIIDENEPYPDARLKTGRYVDWRKKERGE